MITVYEADEYNKLNVVDEPVETKEEKGEEDGKTAE